MLVTPVFQCIHADVHPIVRLMLLLMLLLLLIDGPDNLIQNVIMFCTGLGISTTAVDTFEAGKHECL